MAALELTRGRKAKASDIHDLQHLTLGLSRCFAENDFGGIGEYLRSRLD